MCAPQVAAEAGVCLGENATLECLKKNFQSLYATNYPQFWKILHSEFDEAQKCKPIKRTAEFVELVGLQSANAEFNEFRSESIEVLSVSNVECLLDAALLVENSKRTMLIDLLRHPLFLEEEKIRSSFELMRTKKKYREIVELYFLVQ